MDLIIKSPSFPLFQRGMFYDSPLWQRGVRGDFDVELLLWSHLRAGRFEGMKFRWQHPIGKYIADFEGD